MLLAMYASGHVSQLPGWLQLPREHETRTHEILILLRVEVIRAVQGSQNVPREAKLARATPLAEAGQPRTSGQPKALLHHTQCRTAS